MKKFSIKLSEKTIGIVFCENQKEYDSFWFSLCLSDPLVARHPSARQSATARSVVWSTEQQKAKQEFGFLLFCRPTYTLPILTHEAVHMAWDFCNSRLADFQPGICSDHNEYLAVATEEIVRKVLDEDICA